VHGYSHYISIFLSLETSFVLGAVTTTMHHMFYNLQRKFDYQLSMRTYEWRHEYTRKSWQHNATPWKDKLNQVGKVRGLRSFIFCLKHICLRAEFGLDKD
jgi:hypothetical protein